MSYWRFDLGELIERAQEDIAESRAELAVQGERLRLLSRAHPAVARPAASKPAPSKAGGPASASSGRAPLLAGSAGSGRGKEP